MLTWRAVSGLFLMAAAGTALASFELVMVADNGTGSFGTRRIHRFDGDTGVYLGSFGGFSENIIGTHLAQATSTLYVMTADGRTAEYNYNTGALRRAYFNGMFTVTTFAAARPSGDVVLSLSGVNAWTQAFPFTTNWLTNIGSLPNSPNFNAGGWIDDRNVFVYDASQGRVAQFNVAENGQAGSVVNTISVGSGYTVSQMTRITSGINDLVVHPVTGQINYYTFGTWGFTPTTSTQNRHSTRAHDGFFTMGLRGSTWSLDKYDNTFSQRGQWGSGVVINPASMQAVVAPEPATMATLGLGVVAVSRLRRRKR